MPQLVATAILSAASIAATSAAGIAITGGVYLATAIGGAAVAKRASRKAAREAESQLQDRRITVRASSEPVNLVLGRTRVGGVQLAPGWTHGTNSEYWTVPIGFAGHRIDAIEDVLFGDESIGTLDGGYWTTSGSKWFKSRAEPAVVVISGGDVGTTYSLSGGLTDLRIDSIAGPPTYEELRTTQNILVQGVDYTIDRDGSNNLRVTWLTDTRAATIGVDLTITYAREVGNAHARARKFLGLAAGERHTELEGWSDGEWLATDLGKNRARVDFTFLYDPDVYPSGPPQQLSIIARGALAYDPRLDGTNGGTGSQRFADTTTWTWTDNPALLWAWYMTLVGVGFGCPSTEIDWPSVITAANICDELVPIDGASGTHKRYTCNGVLTTADTYRTNVDKILSSMVGTRCYSGGKWIVRAGAYVSPTLDLDEDDFGPGAIKILPRTKRRDLFNSVRGLFVDDHAPGALGAGDAGGFYALTDFPQYESATYITEDGGETLWEDIELPMTHDWRRAQRIAKLMLFRARQALTISAVWKLKAYSLIPGDTCRITSAVNGWTTKVFRVVDRRYTPHGDIEMVMQEEASAVYAWDYLEAIDPDPAPNTALPDPRNVGQLRNFLLSAGSFDTLPDGTVKTYAQATWDAITDSAVLNGGRIEIWWKRAADTAYRKNEVRPSETAFRIEPVAGGDIINAFSWVYNGAQVRSEIAFATRQMSSDLPAGVVPAPLSANLLQGADAQYDMSLWTVAQFGGVSDAGIIKEPTYPLLGAPSNFRMATAAPIVGVGGGVIARPPIVPIDPTKLYIAYCDLITWSCDGIVSVQWLDAARNAIGNNDGNLVVGVPNESPTARPDRLEHYQRSRVRATPPATARYAQWMAVLGGSFAAGSAKYLFGTRPFFGEITEGSTEDPPFDPGGGNLISTPHLAAGSTVEVIETYVSQQTGTAVAINISVESPEGSNWGGYDAIVTVNATASIAGTGTAPGTPLVVNGFIRADGGNPVDNPLVDSPTRPIIAVPLPTGAEVYTGSVPLSHRFRLRTLVRNFGESPPKYRFTFRASATLLTTWSVSDVYLRVEVLKK
jgi:hypothetical protein